MWKKIKKDWQEFKAAPPGERFVQTYERSKQRAHGPAASIVIVIVGIVLIIGGLLLGLIPGVPGIVLGVVGFALLATRSRRIAIGLDWTEGKMRKWFGKRRKSPAPTR